MTAAQLSPQAIVYLAELLERATGQILDRNNGLKIMSAIRPIMRGSQIDDIDILTSRLKNPTETDLHQKCIDALVNNETSFYRDRDVFQKLLGPVIDSLYEQRKTYRKLRIWSAGCSTGQEAYSIAMHFAEQQTKWAGWHIDIIGSDASQSAVNQARRGRYSQFEIQKGLPVTTMLRYFKQEGSDWVVDSKLAGMVRFNRQNLLEDCGYHGHFDLILCRNVLLHLSPVKKQQLLKNLGNALDPDGWLMLGAGETTIGHSDTLVSDHRFGIFYRHADSVPGVV